MNPGADRLAARRFRSRTSRGPWVFCAAIAGQPTDESHLALTVLRCLDYLLEPTKVGNEPDSPKGLTGMYAEHGNRRFKEDDPQPDLTEDRAVETGWPDRGNATGSSAEGLR